MRKGKMIAQGAHASMKAVLDHFVAGYKFILQGSDAPRPENPWDYVGPEVREWLNGRFTKICVSVNSEAELKEVYEKAKAAGIICSLIEDSGLTEFKGVPTLTCCAIGPDYPEKIDPITGELDLL